MLILAYVLGEVHTFYASCSADPAEHDTSQLSIILLINGTMAFFLNYSNFQFTRHTSALTVTVAGNVKHVLTILLSVALFRNPISAVNAVGSAIAIAGAAWYSFSNYKEKTR